MNITTSQIQSIHALLPAVIKNDAEQKANLIQQYTKDYRKSSTKDLTFNQANEIIVRFGGKAHNYQNWGRFDIHITSHRLILSLLQQMGWQQYDEERRRWLADIHRFSEWLKSDKSPVQKPLLKMEPEEVSKIIVALENMVG